MKIIKLICNNCGKEIESDEEVARMIEVKEPMYFPMHFCSWECLLKFAKKYKGELKEDRT